MSSFREAKNPTVGTARRASVMLNNELKFETNNKGDLGRDKTMHHELNRLESQTFKDAIGSTRLEVLKNIFESLAKMEKVRGCEERSDELIMRCLAAVDQLRK